MVSLFTIGFFSLIIYCITQNEMFYHIYNILWIVGGIYMCIGGLLATIYHNDCDFDLLGID